MNSMKKWSLAGTMITLFTGSMLHFVYEIFGGTVFSILGAVNESTWEHLKLIFWPVIFFGIIEFIIYGRKQESFIAAKVISIYAGMLAIVSSFYTYTGIVGDNFLWADIATFVIGVVSSYGIFLKLMKPSGKWTASSFVSVCAAASLLYVAVMFVLFTYSPPQLGIFEDPLAKIYGE